MGFGHSDSLNLTLGLAYKYKVQIPNTEMKICLPSPPNQNSMLCLKLEGCSISICYSTTNVQPSQSLRALRTRHNRLPRILCLILQPMPANIIRANSYKQTQRNAYQ